MTVRKGKQRYEGSRWFKDLHECVWMCLEVHESERSLMKISNSVWQRRIVKSVTKGYGGV